MSTTYTKTDNFGLNLYGDSDPADLRDGYNGSMEIIDSNLLTVATTANSAETTANSAETTANSAKTTADKAADDIKNLDSKVDANRTRADSQDSAQEIEISKNRDDINTLGTRMDAAPTTSSVLAQITDYSVPNPSHWDMLCIGDSYGSGYGSSNESTGPDGKNLYNYMREILKPSGFHNMSVGGAGFVHGASVGGGHQYGVQLSDFYNSNRDEASKITHIVVTGGQNDTGQDGVENAASKFVSDARNMFPNARIIVVPGQYQSMNPGNRIVPYGQIMRGAGAAGAETHPYAYSWLLGQDDLINQSVSHPNDDGYKLMGYKLASVLLGGSSDMPYYGEAYTGGSGYTLEQNVAGYEAGAFHLNINVKGASSNWKAGTRFAFLPRVCRITTWFHGDTTGAHSVVMNCSENGQFGKDPILTVAQVGSSSNDNIFIHADIPIA